MGGQREGTAADSGQKAQEFVTRARKPIPVAVLVDAKLRDAADREGGGNVGPRGGQQEIGAGIEVGDDEPIGAALGGVTVGAAVRQVDQVQAATALDGGGGAAAGKEELVGCGAGEGIDAGGSRPEGPDPAVAIAIKGEQGLQSLTGAGGRSEPGARGRC